MKIIIAGCGKVGDIIIKSLTAEGHEVTVIDSDNAVLQTVSNTYDVICIHGNCTDYDSLQEANVKNADMFVAVTGSDELNMLSCFIAKHLGTNHTIARIRNPEYNDNSQGSAFIKQQLDLSLVINPEMMAAQELFNILKLPSAVNIETFAKRKFEMIELMVKPDTLLDGIALSDLRKKMTEKFLICVVMRGDNVYIPDGNFVIKAGDRIGMTAEPVQIQKLLKKLSILQKQARKIMIIGASRVSYYLAKSLVASGNTVKIVEIDRKRCEEISRLLPGADIINGDGAEQDILLEEGINDMDAFVALTGMDEENILLSFYAYSLNLPKVITKVNRSELAKMADRLGLDSIVSPKKITADIIVRYARALQNSEGSKMETLYKIMSGKAEALEFIVEDSFNYVNIPLKDLDTKDNVIIAGIIRGRKSIIPTGDDFIAPDDRVIVISAGHIIEDLSDIIK
ncbi:MAG: Trk system potassium transporter TrkA [Clostridia bacterium]|nr:Trk system potassium transporter TrkA [Clostridia bacterium]